MGGHRGGTHETTGEWGVGPAWGQRTLTREESEH